MVYTTPVYVFPVFHFILPINETSEAFPICGVLTLSGSNLAWQNGFFLLTWNSTFVLGNVLCVLRLECSDTRRLQKGAAEARKNYFI